MAWWSEKEGQSHEPQVHVATQSFVVTLSELVTSWGVSQEFKIMGLIAMIVLGTALNVPGLRAGLALVNTRHWAGIGARWRVVSLPSSQLFPFFHVSCRGRSIHPYPRSAAICLQPDLGPACSNFSVSSPPLCTSIATGQFLWDSWGTPSAICPTWLTHSGLMPAAPMLKRCTVRLGVQLLLQ